jgi:hypothetical protein
MIIQLFQKQDDVAIFKTSGREVDDASEDPANDNSSLVVDSANDNPVEAYDGSRGHQATRESMQQIPVRL